MQFIDTHCHLHFENYDEDRIEVLADAKEHNVTQMICVGCSLKDSEKATHFAAKHENIWAAVGVHPHSADEFLKNPEALEKLISVKISSLDLSSEAAKIPPSRERYKLSILPKVIAVGEIGLDYFRSTTTKADQEKALRQQIELALEKNLPIIFHVREAFTDFFKVVDSYQNIKGVVHSFSAHPAEVDEVLKRGFYVGLNGIMTFTKDEQQLEAAKKVPLDKLLLETDAPFLTPKPYRGKRCEPKHVILVAEFLASLRGESLEEIASTTTKNAIELFGMENKSG